MYIYSLRNSKDVRNSCYDTREISIDDHMKYMANFSGFQWIVFVGSNTIGHCKIVGNEIGLMIDEKFRGKGYGSKIMKLIFKEAKKLGINRLESNVRCDNKISAIMSENSGLELDGIRTIKNVKYFHFKKIIGDAE